MAALSGSSWSPEGRWGGDVTLGPWGARGCQPFGESMVFHLQFFLSLFEHVMAIL